MPFASFEESHAYFRQTCALDESPSGLGLLSYLRDPHRRTKHPSVAGIVKEQSSCV